METITERKILLYSLLQETVSGNDGILIFNRSLKDLLSPKNNSDMWPLK